MGKSTNTATSTSSPWPPAENSLKGILTQADALYKGGSAGSVAPLSSQTQTAINAITAGSRTADPNLAAGDAATQNLLSGKDFQATARGDYLSQPSPYLESQLSDQSNKISDQLRSIYSGAGRYGSATMNRDLADRLGNLRMGVLSTNYENERDRQMQAAGAIQSGQQAGIAAIPGMAEARFGPANRLFDVGSYLDQYEQTKRDNPWARLSNYQGIVSGAAGGYGSQTQQTPGPSRLSQILGGAAGVAGVAGKLLPLLSLSDARAKTDIKRVGSTDGGIGVYTYRYKSGGPTQMGVLAQEVAAKKPQAAGRFANGLLGVDYEQVT